MHIALFTLACTPFTAVDDLPHTLHAFPGIFSSFDSLDVAIGIRNYAITAGGVILVILRNSYLLFQCQDQVITPT